MVFRTRDQVWRKNEVICGIEDVKKKTEFILGGLVQTHFLFSFVFDMSIFAFSHLISAQTTENVGLPTATKALGYFGLLKGAPFCGSHSKNVINNYYTYPTPSYII